MSKYIYVMKITRRVVHVEQELLTLPEQTSLPLVLGGVCVSQFPLFERDYLQTGYYQLRLADTYYLSDFAIILGPFATCSKIL
jgi:hypothetical protein